MLDLTSPMDLRKFATQPAALARSKILSRLALGVPVENHADERHGRAQNAGRGSIRACARLKQKVAA